MAPARVVAPVRGISPLLQPLGDGGVGGGGAGRGGRHGAVRGELRAVVADQLHRARRGRVRGPRRRGVRGAAAHVGGGAGQVRPRGGRARHPVRRRAR